MRTRPAVLPAALVLSGLLAVGIAGPASAHGDTIHFDISSRAGGHPQTVATWENDGDPVTETLAATLSAVSADGHRVGPWRLVAVPGAAATFTTEEALPAGQWKVSVESGFPALGRGEADLTVAAAAPALASAPAAAPAPVGAVPSTAPATPRPVAAAGSSAGFGWGTAGIVAAVAAAAAAAVALTIAARRRRRP